MPAVSCCAEQRLVPDARFAPKNGPVAERVMQCGTCGALWLEEWHVRVGYGGQDDRDIFQHRRITVDEAAAAFTARR